MGDGVFSLQVGEGGGVFSLKAGSCPWVKGNVHRGMIHGDRLNFSLTPEQRLTLRCVAPAPEEDGMAA